MHQYAVMVGVFVAFHPLLLIIASAVVEGARRHCSRPRMMVGGLCSAIVIGGFCTSFGLVDCLVEWRRHRSPGRRQRVAAGGRQMAGRRLHGAVRVRSADVRTTFLFPATAARMEPIEPASLVAGAVRTTPPAPVRSGGRPARRRWRRASSSSSCARSPERARHCFGANCSSLPGGIYRRGCSVREFCAGRWAASR